MNDMRVTVTVADLEAAIASIGENHIQRCGECLIAQAMRRTVGRGPVSVGLSMASAPGYPTFVIPDEVTDLINLFDNEAYDVLRELLPVTFVMEAR